MSPGPLTTTYELLVLVVSESGLSAADSAEFTVNNPPAEPS